MTNGCAKGLGDRYILKTRSQIVIWPGWLGGDTHQPKGGKKKKPRREDNPNYWPQNRKWQLGELRRPPREKGHRIGMENARNPAVFAYLIP